MKRFCLLLMVLAAFAFTAVAQDASPTSSSSGQTSTSKDKSDHSGMAMDHQGMGKSSGKGSTLTGCLSSSANSEGMYTLSNAKNKKGVEVGPTDKVKDHAGHQVSLMGKWATGAEAGEKAGTKEEKGERHFEVDSVKHISETCSEAPGGGTAGTKGGAKKSKGTGDSSSTPKE